MSVGWLGVRPADACDGGTEFGVRSEDPVVPVAMDARGRYETSQPLKKLKRREPQLGAAVGTHLRRVPRLGQPIDEPGLGRGERDDAAGGVQPLKSEGRTSTVAE